MNRKLIGAMIVSSLASSVSAHEGVKSKTADGKADYVCQNNSCKGKAECMGFGNSSCKGSNECKGHGILMIKDKKECEKKHGKWALMKD